MNFAHIHLIINHAPIIGIPVALVFLLHGLWTRDSKSQRISLFIISGLALMALPVYLTGEPAEDVISNLTGFNKSLTEPFIESHEEAALISLILSLITGVSALTVIWQQKFRKDELKFRKMGFIVFGIAAIATLSLGYTAKQGGQIRHPELRPQSTMQAMLGVLQTTP